MFFIASKTVGWLLTPTNFMLALALVGLILTTTRFAKAGLRFVLVSATLILVCAFLPLGYWLLVPIEDRFPTWNAAAGPPDGIIILGGSIAPDISKARGKGVFPNAADRLVTGAELAKRYPEAFLVFTGGSATLAIGDGREADYAPEIFERLGLSRNRMVLERESRNTAENALLVARLAQPKAGSRWLLVTSAYHMPRSVGLFRKAGFNVEPYPVDWLTSGPVDFYRFGEKPLDGLVRVDMGTREWIGMLAAYLSGKSDEFFPSKRP